MVVHVLPAIGHVQPVQHDVAALRVEPRRDVVAGQDRTQREGAGSEAATLPLLHMNGTDMKCTP
jgi:hypothetical protein